jgi:citrate-Mg2+:H+ or citrate-Ca2+:H+ symporter, CitMHS family
VIAVALGTALLGMAAHLDGAGATTFLLTVPALLPLFRRLNMNPYLMLMLLALGAGVLNMTPWAGPMGRASAVTGIDVTALWHPLIAIQAIGAVLLVLLASLLGIRELSRIRAGSVVAPGDHRHTVCVEAEDEASLSRPGRLWLNCVLFVAVLASLISAILPAAYVFMIGLATALIINYPSVEEQVERIKAHAPNALLMGSIILAAGAFLGIKIGMLKSMAQDLNDAGAGACAGHAITWSAQIVAPMPPVQKTM